MKTNFIKDLDPLVQHKLYQGFRHPCPTQTTQYIYKYLRDNESGERLM
jgi:hypothetical protein